MILKLLTKSAKTLTIVLSGAVAASAAWSASLPPMPSWMPISVQVQEQVDVDWLIAQLAAPAPYDRAMAACRLGDLRDADISAARTALLGLLGDGAAVDGELCREWGNWRGGRRQASSPGREAAIALERLGDDVLDDVVDILRSGDATAREHAALALGLLESSAAIAPLADALDDEVDAVRGRAAWALGMIESPTAVPALEEALRDDSATVRSQAAWALGMIEASSAVPTLVDALDDGSQDVREQAAWALGMIESSSAVPALVRALQDDSADVREQAAWALGMIEDAAAVEGLIEALQDDDAEVRRQVLWALTRCVDGDDPSLDYEALADKLRRALRGGD